MLDRYHLNILMEILTWPDCTYTQIVQAALNQQHSIKISKWTGCLKDLKDHGYKITEIEDEKVLVEW